MPKVNLIQKPKTDYKAFIAKIAYAREYYGIPYEDMAATINMSLATFYMRLKKPGDFTINEIQKLTQKIHMAAELTIDGMKII